MKVLSSAFGHYEASGFPDDADCVVGHSFGTSIDLGSVNHSLADYIDEHALGRPVVVDRMLANAFPNGGKGIDYIVEGPVSGALGGETGTWNVLVKAKDFMTENGLERPLMVAQAHHIGRVVMQAQKLNIKSIIPPGLPASFDHDSNQFWTRSKAIWIPRELIGSALLKAQNRL